MRVPVFGECRGECCFVEALDDVCADDGDRYSTEAEGEQLVVRSIVLFNVLDRE